MSAPTLDVDVHVEKRYMVERYVGGGAYGVVWRAVDRKSGQVVALKKVYDGLAVQQDAQRTYREVALLQRLDHPNIVKLLNVMRSVNGQDLYLVFELIETDLNAVIRSGILQPIHKQFVTYQLLRAIRHLHARKVIHRDLKPANLLLNSDCLMKLADFGLARSLANLSTEQQQRGAILTDYIATRWYRAPEVLVGTTSYSLALDMWAVGCIIAELLIGHPLFRGDSTLNQLSMIVCALGEPSEEDIAGLGTTHGSELFEQLPPPSKPQDPLRQMLAGQPPHAVNLISALLMLNPQKRLTAAEAMQHPYVAPFCTAEELVEDSPLDHLPPLDIPLPDETRFSIGEYRQALYNEITKTKQESRQRKRNSLKIVESPQ